MPPQQRALTCVCCAVQGVSATKVCDMKQWMTKKKYKDVKQYEPPIYSRLLAAMTASV